MKVLLVEDGPGDALLVRELLAEGTDGGWIVEWVDRFSRAEEWLSRETPDAVLLDLGLPDTEGLRAVAALASRFPALPVVVLTGINDKSVGVAAVEAGAQDFVVKGRVEADSLARSLQYAVERKRSEVALRASERRLADLLGNLQAGVLILDSQGKVVSANRVAREMLGLARDQPLRGVLPHLVGEDSRPLAEEAFPGLRALRARQPVKDVVGVRRPDTTLGWFIVDAVPRMSADDGDGDVVCTCVEISDRKRAEVALHESEARYRALVDGSLGLICTHDLEGVLLTMNPAGAQIIGYEPTELLGRSLATLVPARYKEAFAGYLRGIRQEGVHRGLLTLTGKDGRSRVLTYHNVLREPAGEQPYVLGHAQDVSERVRLEQQLREQGLRDPLTGCYNRRYLARFEASAGDEPWGCLMIDIDRFKHYNDTYGHQAGDEILVKMGRFLARYVRAREAVVRIGGDEFVVLLVAVDEAAARLVAERLATGAQGEAPVSFSLGWATRQGHEMLERTISRADQNLLSVRVGQRSFESRRVHER